MLLRRNNRLHRARRGIEAAAAKSSDFRAG
jgi:hypothetical protein